MMTGKLAATALMVGLALGSASCRTRIEPSANPFNRDPLNERCAKTLPVKEAGEFSVEAKNRGLNEVLASGLVRRVAKDGVELDMEMPNGQRIVVNLKFGEDMQITGIRDPLGVAESGRITACSGAEGEEARLGGTVVKYE